MGEIAHMCPLITHQEPHSEIDWLTPDCITSPTWIVQRLQISTVNSIVLLVGTSACYFSLCPPGPVALFLLRRRPSIVKGSAESYQTTAVL